MSDLRYITIQEIRDEGIPIEDYSDARVTEMIIKSADYVDLMTGRWFEDLEKTLIKDGTGNKLITLDVPIISISSIEIGDWSTTPEAIDVSTYKVYNRKPEDDQNPHIKFYNKVKKGVQNVNIIGHFGYVDEDGNTPVLIKRVMKKLTIGSLPLLSSDESEEQTQNMKLIAERTDGHSYELSDLLSDGSVTGDPEIDDIIQRFRRPVRVGSA